MTKYPMNDTLIDEESVQIRIQKNKYNKCCINKNVCAILSIVACIVTLIGGITCINIYSQYIEDGSL